MGEREDARLEATGMRLGLDAKVKTRDGEDAGTVQWAIIDPRSNDVTDVVVRAGAFLGRDVVVPRAELDRASADGDVLRLQLGKEELDNLPAYAPAQYVAPPPDWVPPAGYGLPYSSFLWPAAAPYTAPGYVYPAAYGYGAGAAAPPAVPAQAPESQGIELGKGTIVIDRDGEDIGVVDDVRFDAGSGDLRGFVLRLGGTLRTLFGGGDMVEVSAAQVERVGAGTVRLNVTKDQLARVAGSRP